MCTLKIFLVPAKILPEMRILPRSPRTTRPRRPSMTRVDMSLGVQLFSLPAEVTHLKDVRPFVEVHHGKEELVGELLRIAERIGH